MAETHTPPKESNGAGTPPQDPNKVMGRNILTGVITTVVGATIIYFLGFYKKSGDSGETSLLLTKENTIQGWQSFISTENTFFNNWKILGENYNTTSFDYYKKETLRELDRLKTDITKILDGKKMDASLVSLLERRLVTKDLWEEKYKIHLDKYENLSSITDQEERTRKLNEEVQRYYRDIADINQRFINELTETSGSLSKKYNYTFSPSELMLYKQLQGARNENKKDEQVAVVDPKMLVGTWQTRNEIGNIGTLYHYDNGTMYYYFSSGDSTYGRWEIKNNQLHLHYDQFWGAGQVFRYNLSNVTGNGFTMTFADPPNNIVIALRKN